MDVFMLLFLSIISILFGIIITLVVQYYVLLKYFDKNPTASPPKKPHDEVFTLPETLKKKLEAEGQDSTDSSMAISLMLQFLFHELRHSDTIKRWLYKKLSLEFEELITKTTTGKFFDAVTIRDMNLGSQFPNVKSIGVESVRLDKTEGHIDTLNLCVKLDYSGNFLISVDAKMKFGKTAYLSIMVKQVNGLARLQFTRLPYTHWNFSFYTEPELELAVESHFQGRQLQSNVTNLIVNQIKKAIKRKHTLPNYKIRYKPFFIKADPGQLDILDDSEIIPQGKLDVMCMEVSRLATSNTGAMQVYCTFAIDSTPWISVYQKESQLYMVLELRISKLLQQQIGVSFKFEQNQIIVDSVTPQMAADRASLKVGDILLSVEGKIVTNITQLNKILKLTPSGNFSLRVERVCNNYTLKSKFLDKTDPKTPTSNINSIIENDFTQIEQEDNFIVIEAKSKSLDVNDSTKKLRSNNSTEKIKSDRMPLPKLISTSNENVSRFAQTIGNFSLRKRKPSIERASTESSTKSTPNVSLPTTPQHSSLKHSSATTLMIAKKHSIVEASENDKVENLETEATEFNEIYKGQLKEILSVINCKEEYSFNLKETDKYLNINVWGLTNEGKDVLLGYTNISLAEVLNQCSNSMLGHYIRSFSFLPPTSTPPSSQSHPLMLHSGFEHVFCYGDTLLSFMWSHENSEIKRQSMINESFIKEGNSMVKHDFVRTQFHRTTHCDFCSKKIWLKDAVQCRKCNLCCHKKCLIKCQLNMPCVPIEKLDIKSETSDNLHPEITMTEVADNDLECEIITQYPASEAKQHYGALKRVNSANNLAIPGSHFTQNQSRSLPPSPQHTPRKLSLVVSNPFSVCPIMLDEIQQQPNEAGEIILRAVDQVLQYPSDESLMDVAKETGTQMYASMEHEIKIEKINLMVTELKRALDDVTIDHMSLSKQLGSTETEVEKAKLAFLIGQADAKIQALSVLMLHYCSGLQHAQEKIV